MAEREATADAAEVKAAMTRLARARASLGARGRRLRHACLALSVLPMLGSGVALAATPEAWTTIADTVFQQVTTARGLPNPIALSIAEDGAGFVWVGTGGGLARWDGTRFRVHKAGDSGGGLRDNFIQALHADPLGRVWIGGAGGGLSRYDPVSDTITAYDAGGAGPVEVSAIEDDGAGGVWVGGSGTLRHLPADAVPAMPAARGAPAGLPPGKIFALLHDRQGALWAGTQVGLYRRAGSAASFQQVVLAPAGAQPGAVLALLQDHAGRIWAGTAALGVYVADETGSGVRHVAEAGIPASPGVSDPGIPVQEMNVGCLAEPRPGEIWAGTVGFGIVAISEADLGTRRIRHDAGSQTSLLDDTVWGLYRDRSGAVWAATQRGLSRTDPQQTGILTVLGSASHTGVLTDTDPNAILAGPDGLIRVGLLHNGIDVIDPGRAPAGEPGTGGRRVGDIRAGPGFPSAIVSVLAWGRPGEMIVGTWKGLFSVPAAGGAPVAMKVPPAAAGHGVDALARIGDTLWVAEGDVLFTVDALAPWAPPRVVAVPSDLRSDLRVRVIAPAGGGKLWLGTWTGLKRLDPATGTIAAVPLGRADPAGDLVVSLTFEDFGAKGSPGHGRLWVGTGSGGIEVLDVAADGKATPVRRLTIADGLPNDTIDKLLQDGAGHVWASTDDGLAEIDTATFAVRQFHEADGVSIAAYYADSGAITAGGALVFGGAGGLTVVEPLAVNGVPYRAPLVVTELRVDGRKAAAGRFNAGERNARASAPLVVPAGARGLDMAFTTLDYAGRDRDAYAYRMAGLDTDWTVTDQGSRLAIYTNLPPGRFSLLLRASSPDATRAPAILSIPIHVLPSWWQTTWFLVTEVLGGLLCLALLVWLSTVFLRRRQTELQGLIAQRTAELARSNEALTTAAQTLRHLAYSDGLTDLPNRRLYSERLARMVTEARADGRRFALLLIDLDRFKEVNDTHGHDAGDALLVAAAGRLRQAADAEDFVTRLGGDEFAILLDDCATEPQIAATCQRVLRQFAEPMPWGDIRIGTTASIGVAIFPDHGETPATLYKAADLAMYEAKRGGCDTWRMARRPEAPQDAGKQRTETVLPQ